MHYAGLVCLNLLSAWELSRLQAPLYGSVNDWGYFFIDVFIGANKLHRQSLIIDTGSTMTAMACLSCESCGSHMDEPYVESADFLFDNVPCDGDYKCAFCDSKEIHDVASPACAYEIHYAEGSSIYGNLGSSYATLQAESYSTTDYITNTQVFYEPRSLFNDPQAKMCQAFSILGKGKKVDTEVFKQIITERCSFFKLHFGCHVVETNLFKGQRAIGIMGLENGSVSKSPSFLDDISQAYDIGKSVAICLAEEGGVISFAGPNEQFITGTQMRVRKLSAVTKSTLQQSEIPASLTETLLENLINNDETPKLPKNIENLQIPPNPRALSALENEDDIPWRTLPRVDRRGDTYTVETAVRTIIEGAHRRLSRSFLQMKTPPTDSYRVYDPKINEYIENKILNEANHSDDLYREDELELQDSLLVRALSKDTSGELLSPLLSINRYVVYVMGIIMTDQSGLQGFPITVGNIRTLLDTGTTMTYLPKTIYEAASDRINRSIQRNTLKFRGLSTDSQYNVPILHFNSSKYPKLPETHFRVKRRRLEQLDITATEKHHGSECWYLPRGEQDLDHFPLIEIHLLRSNVPYIWHPKDYLWIRHAEKRIYCLSFQPSYNWSWILFGSQFFKNKDIWLDHTTLMVSIKNAECPRITEGSREESKEYNNE